MKELKNRKESKMNEYNAVFYCPDRTEFCLPFIFNGAKCNDVSSVIYTDRVLFEGSDITYLVSPDYILKPEEYKKIIKK